MALIELYQKFNPYVYINSVLHTLSNDSFEIGHTVTSSEHDILGINPGVELYIWMGDGGKDSTLINLYHTMDHSQCMRSRPPGCKFIPINMQILRLLGLYYGNAGYADMPIGEFLRKSMGYGD